MSDIVPESCHVQEQWLAHKSSAKRTQWLAGSVGWYDRISGSEW